MKLVCSSLSLAEQGGPLQWDPAWRLVLASASPQRAAILQQAGVEAVVRPTEVVEETDGAPADVALANAVAKARAGRAALSDGERGGSLVLSADTVVALGQRILGKPADRDQAAQYLRALSASSHAVLGGVAVISPAGELRTAIVSTAVRFRELSAEDVADYVDGGEWRGRAGGYAIQLSGDRFVSELGPDELNVVGLSLTALASLVQGLLPAGIVTSGRYTA